MDAELNQRLNADPLVRELNSAAGRPCTLAALSKILVEKIPQHLKYYWELDQLPFPVEFVQQIGQDDVDRIYVTIDPESKGQDEDRYAQLALMYFGINLPAREDCPRGIPDDNVEEIKRRLNSYGEEGVSIPSLFFISLMACQLQHNLESRRQRTGSAENSLRSGKKWVRRVQGVIRELLEADTKIRIESELEGWTRLSMTPGDVLRCKVAQEVEKLDFKPLLEELHERIDKAVQWSDGLHGGVGNATKRAGLKQGANYVQPLQRAFLAIRDMIAEARQSPRAPRDEILSLFRLWGVEVSKQASDKWV